MSAWVIVKQLQVPGATPNEVADANELSMREVEAALALCRARKDLIDARTLRIIGRQHDC